MFALMCPWFCFSADQSAAKISGFPNHKIEYLFYDDFGTYPFEPDEYRFLRQEKFLWKSNKTLCIDSKVHSRFGVEWQTFRKWRFAADWRIHFRYSGFMDPVINWWHDLLNALDSGRSYFSDNRSYWNIIRESGTSYSAKILL